MTRYCFWPSLHNYYFGASGTLPTHRGTYGINFGPREYHTTPTGTPRCNIRPRRRSCSDSAPRSSCTMPRTSFGSAPPRARRRRTGSRPPSRLRGVPNPQLRRRSPRLQTTKATTKCRRPEATLRKLRLSKQTQTVVHYALPSLSRKTVCVRMTNKQKETNQSLSTDCLKNSKSVRVSTTRVRRYFCQHCAQLPIEL